MPLILKINFNLGQIIFFLSLPRIVANHPEPIAEVYVESIPTSGNTVRMENSVYSQRYRCLEIGKVTHKQGSHSQNPVGNWWPPLPIKGRKSTLAYQSKEKSLSKKQSGNVYLLCLSLNSHKMFSIYYFPCLLKGRQSCKPVWLWLPPSHIKGTSL